MDLANQLIREVLQDDLESAETSIRSGDQAAALAAIEQAMVKLNSALSALSTPERTHGTAGPII